MRTALICGITGQDGAYLARLLLGKGYRVVGTSRDAASADLSGLEALGARQRVEVRTWQPTDREGARALVADVAPDEVYLLAAQSSVGLSFERSAETVKSAVLGTLAMLEAIRDTCPAAKLCLAGSGECFGNTDGRPVTEGASFRPESPYAAAKAAAHMLLDGYRRGFGLFAVTAFLFNHESPLRAERFVTRKIVAAAARIAAGADDRLRLGRIDVARDWGWAPEYVEPMWRMLQAPAPSDFVIATGESRPLREFVEHAFDHFGLDWARHVDHDPSLDRPRDPLWTGGDPSRAARELGWRAEVHMPEVVRRLCAFEQTRVSPSGPSSYC